MSAKKKFWAWFYTVCGLFCIVSVVMGEAHIIYLSVMTVLANLAIITDSWKSYYEAKERETA